MYLLDFAEDIDAVVWSTAKEWIEFAEEVNVGDLISGRVIATKSYGLFVDFGAPFPALVEVPNLRRDRLPIDVGHLPKIGETMRCEIIQIVPHRRVVRAIERST